MKERVPSNFKSSPTNSKYALTIAGKKKKITLQNFLDFETGLGLSKKQMNSVLKRFKELQKDALSLINKSFLSDGMQVDYKAILKRRFEILG